MEKLMHPVVEAGQILGLPRSRMFELIEAGEIGSVKVGRRRMIPHADLVEYVERLRTQFREAEADQFAAS